MHSPFAPTGLRRLGRRAAYELFQLALWVALVLRTLVGLRSAFGGGGQAAAPQAGKAIRPRRVERPSRGPALTGPAQ